MGLISQAGYNDDKVKFMILNSNLTVINFNITDFNQYGDLSVKHSTFHAYDGFYSWVIIK